MVEPARRTGWFMLVAVAVLAFLHWYAATFIYEGVTAHQFGVLGLAVIVFGGALGFLYIAWWEERPR